MSTFRRIKTLARASVPKPRAAPSGEAMYVTVGKAGSIPNGEIRAFAAAGHRVSVANTVGHLYAFDDTCTHRGCSLAEAELDGTTITCICHGSRFDVTSGALLRGPAERPIGTYPVREEGGDLQIEA